MSSISSLQPAGLDGGLPAKPVEDPPSAASPSFQSPPAVASVVANFPSPITTIDPVSNRVIFEYRDASSGLVTQQVPSKDAVRLYEESAGRPAEPASQKVGTSL